MDTTIERIREVISALPSASKYYSYGTAGFRDKYTPSMHVVFVKVGILAALRSLNVNGQAIGVMITASHNAKEDNGVKIVDPDGGMLTQSWENTAEKLVNADVDGFIHGLIQFIAEKKIQLLSVSPLVIIGADCRDHSPILSEFVRKGVEIVLNGIYHHIGRSTTPLLHYVVAGVNQDTSFSVSNPFDATKYINAYFDDLYFGFTDLVKSADKVSSGTSALILDCAYGVGSVTSEQFLQHISARGGLPNWEIQIRNRVGEGPVNENSGAEHCQKLQIPCHGVSAEQDHHQLLCSFDGDADRIVFHAFPEAQASSWTLLDGDRIASLIAQFLNAELLAAGLVDKIDVGIVQTAYANGSSTHFLKNNGIQIHITKTGVKYLHHKAHELDIGIYFEANGHGTVLFSKKYRDLLASESLKIGSEYADQPRKVLALKRLQASLRVVNPTVGDALSDLLFSLAILTVSGMSYEDWIKIYSELPSRQVKVAVPDKSRLKCSEDETYLISPESLQQELNVLMNSVPMGRIFIRPSGTEDVVRIYAEATAKEDVEMLVNRTKELIHQFYSK